MIMRTGRRTFLQTILVAAVLRDAHAGAPANACDSNSTAEDVTRGLDLSGKTALVTGCTSGIGFEAMRALAMRGAHVIGTGRTTERAREACSGVQGKTTPVALELSDFQSVVACADAVQKLNVSIDMLILNAGIVLDKLEQVNGLERQFVVNHLGHFVLANRLLERVKASPQGRVVSLGSGSHFSAPPGGIQFANLSGKGWAEQGFGGYGHSKLANGLFSLELARRLQGTRATSNCVMPGTVLTDIFRNLPASKADALNSGRKTADHGAATPCYVATNPKLADVSGEYFANCAPAPQSEYQKDKAMAAKLWDVSTELTRDYLG